MDIPSARLRRTFRYPADESDDDSQPEAMDEEEQEDFIRRLAIENTSQNALFARVLTVVPILSSIPYIPSLFRPATTLLSLLSITCLLSTALLTYRLPYTLTGMPVLDDRRASGHHSKNKNKDKIKMGGGGGGRTVGAGAGDSPLDRYLPYLNGALAILLILVGLVVPRSSAAAAASLHSAVVASCLPALIYGVVVVAKVVMAGVDPEEQLSSLKYQYRGA
ncbi:hypothetical protein GMORB2_6445 [Geosmithia morbida]|uniref:Uncharacterized protein n=1 Tax=Geosmithia morbida TaxID=1094350 RepID=A0A9P4YXS2_9HYPO|nr:uncharacterized protein GMORB2_6445 [Geosmithia morbida]KAF4123744.1 hypothetical protein GMORB2_6445 [Geosmithia morbida]